MLNSKLLEWRFRLTSTNNHVSTREIANLPAYHFLFTTTPEERLAEVTRCINSYMAGNDQAVLQSVNECLFSEPERGDVVHDLLAHLAERMMDLHRERHAARARFVDWLRDNQGVPVETFTRKAKLDNFHTGTYADFAAWMKGNKYEIAYQDNAKYQRAFTDASAEMQGIETRITATDRLIDRIVYALYGLTADEIAIVEGGVP
ncbi:MAG: hypothetical protein ACYDAR_12195 [Thermomicrobiales bacterium]